MCSPILPCTVNDWREAYISRYAVRKTVSGAVEEATSRMLHQDEIPKCILRLLGDYNTLTSDTFLASSVVDEFFCLSKYVCMMHSCDCFLCRSVAIMLYALLYFSSSNLSEQYYAKQFLELFLPEVVKVQWQRFVSDQNEFTSIPLGTGENDG